MERILIGKIVSVRGIKGEVKVYCYSSPNSFKKLKHIILKKNNEEFQKKIISFKEISNMACLLLEDVNDRNASEKLVNFEVYITDDQLEKLPPNQYYIKDLIGLDVINNETKEYIGEVCDVLQYTPQDNYEVKLLDGSKVLIPGIKEFIYKIDLDEKKIYVNVIPGLLGDGIEV